MVRTFDPKDLIVLPRLGAQSAAVLMRMLLATAKSVKKLPPSIAADRDELGATHETLQAVLRHRLAPIDPDSPTVRAADIAEDNGWGALEGWLYAWSKLPSEKFPEAAEIRTIHATVFPTGLKFTQIDVFLEWQEAETRLSLMKERKFDVTIRNAGGGPFLDHLAAVHQHYGEVQGITVANKKEAAALPTLKEALDLALEAIRTYALRVSAYARKSDPATGELAATLLEPLMSWETASAQASSGEQGTGEGTGGQQPGGQGTAQPGGVGASGTKIE